MTHSIAANGSMPYLKDLILPRKRQMSAENEMITASFASSDGCTVNPPTPSQRRAPFALTPINGTSSSKTSTAARK